MPNNTNTSAVEAKKALIRAIVFDGYHTTRIADADVGEHIIGKLGPRLDDLIAAASLQTKAPVEGGLVGELAKKLGLARELIQEAKGYEGEKGGPITDHLDAAESEMLDVEERLTRLRTDRAMVLEEAAKVADGHREKWACAGGFHNFATAAKMIAEDIRALASKENGNA